MGPPGVRGPDDVSVPDGCLLKGYPAGERVFIGVPSQPSEYFCPDSPVCCFPIRIIMTVCFIQENFPVFETGCAAGTSEAKFEELLSEAEPTADVLAGFMNIDDL